MAPPGVEPWRLTTNAFGEVIAAMAEHSTSARTHQFRVKLSRDGHRRLDERLAAHARLYNAALQERRDAWRMARRSITFASQCRELTSVRQDDPEWSGERRLLAVATLKRVDGAFQAFFRRVKAGETPGFPRFKPRSRFRTIELHSGAGRFVQVNAAGTKATIRIKGLPAMRLRLHRPLPGGQPLVIRITRTPRRVVASLVYAHVDPQPAEAAPARPIGIDAGVAHRFTLSDGRHIERRDVDRRKLRRLQRRVSRAKRGSASRRKKVAALAKEWQRITERNRGDEHQIAAAIVRDYDFIAVEDLQIRNMVRSAAGTVDEPGSNVAAKSSLNRAILDQSWGRLYEKIAYKAASAGGRFVRIPPHHTSQTCAACGVADPKSRRSQEVFICTGWGHAGNADSTIDIITGVIAPTSEQLPRQEVHLEPEYHQRPARRIRPAAQRRRHHPALDTQRGPHSGVPGHRRVDRRRQHYRHHHRRDRAHVRAAGRHRAGHRP